MSVVTRSILAVNPSHATSVESAFWSDFAKRCESAGWRLVQLACREVPDVPGTDTFVMPTRLQEFRRWAPATGSTAWLSHDQVALQVEWEHRRWAHALHQPEIWDAVEQLAAVIDHAIKDIRPAVVLTTNKIDHPCALARRAAQFHDTPVVGLVERSPFESIWFELEGLFCESAIWEPTSRWRSTRVPAGFGERVVESLRANPAGFRSSEVSKRAAEVGDCRRPIVFLPFDNILWTGWAPRDHPQGAVDYPILRDPAMALEGIASAVDELGGTLVIKPHPSCLETGKLFRPPATRMVDASLESLFGAADVTVAFNTKLAFASLAVGIPTVTLAENPAAAGGHTYHWSHYPSLRDILVAALDHSEHPSADAVAHFFGQLELGHFYAPTTSGASARGPIDLFRDLVQRVGPDRKAADPSTGIARFRERRPDGRSKRPAAQMTSRFSRKPPHRPRVVLAADRVVQPHAQSSGIARYGWELVEGLEREDNWELYVLVQEPDVGWYQTAAPLFQKLRSVVGDRLITVSKTQHQDSILDRLEEFSARDVVHSIHLPLPPPRVTGTAARVLTVHDVLHLVRPELHVGKRRPTIDLIVQSIDPSTDYVICDSDHTRRDLMSHAPIPGDRVVTVHLGATCRSPDPTVVERRLPTTWTGYIVAMLQSETRKNCAALLDAVASVLSGDNLAGIGFVAVGTVSAIRLYAQELARIDRSRLVTLADIDDDDLQSLLSAALGFVYPSLYEGFGLPPLEAMAAGCPVVVVPSSSLVEVVGDSGLYAHGGSAEDLAGAIRLLCSSATLRASLSERGRQRASELSWRRTIQETITVYERLTSFKEEIQ